MVAAAGVDEARQRWIETYLTIRDKRGRLRPFRPNSVQRRYERELEAAFGRSLRRHALVLKSRREGITTWEQAKSYYLVCARSHQHCVTLAHDKDSTEKIFAISSLFHEKGFGEARPRLRLSSKREIAVADTGSLFYVGTAGSRAFGRGQTIQRGHGSEVAFWPGDLFTQRNLVAGLTEACSHGDLVLETTANGRRGWFYEEWQAATNGESQFVAIFLPWTVSASNRVPFADEEHRLDFLADVAADEELAAARVRLGLDDEQVHWRWHAMRRLKALFHQEYPEDAETAFLTSGRCFFDADLVVRLMHECVDPPRVEMGGRLKIWRPPEAGKRYVISGDSSEGVPGGDPSCLQVLSIEDFEQVASLHGLYRPHLLGREMASLGRRYNNAFLAPERNNHGHAVVSELIHHEKYPTSRIYHHTRYDERRHRKAQRPGWDTNTETRPLMLDRLARALEERTLKVRDRALLAECLTFESDETGKYQASGGSHDDRVMAMAIAVSVREVRRLAPSITVSPR